VKIRSHSASHSSESSSSNNQHSTSSGSSSSSQSSGKSLLTLGFVDFAAGLEFRLEGGDSIENHVQVDSRECVIELDIDQGKNKRKIVIKPDMIEMDNEQRKIEKNQKITLTGTQKTTLYGYRWVRRRFGRSDQGNDGFLPDGT
jgi:hypothetical protein